MAEASYRIVRRTANSFDVEIDKPDGHRTSVGGFGSEHEAAAWIIQAKRMVRAAGPWTPIVSRSRKDLAHPQEAPR